MLKTNEKLQNLLFELKKIDSNFKFDFNSIENGMMLPKKSLKLNVNGHTVHNDYNREINKKITEIIKKAPSQEKAFEEIQNLIKSTKEKLKDNVLLGEKNVDYIVNF